MRRDQGVALEIAQPPVPAAILHRAHPFAERVQDGHDEQPNRVGAWQTHAVSLRKEKPVGQKLTRVETLNDTEHDSETVYEVQVSNIERERRAAEHDQRSLDAVRRSIGKRTEN